MIESNIRHRFESGIPLILDGAIGSLIQQRGYKICEHLWTSYINFKCPEIIQSIHKEYINAGADIITTNTFRTNPASIIKSGSNLDVCKIVELSVNISKLISNEFNVLLAGSNPPAEDCYQVERNITRSELFYNHKKHIDLLCDNGVNFILNETQSHYDEIKIICNHCSDNNIPYIISLFITNDLKILSGEPLKEIVDFISSFKPLAISLNCISMPVFLKVVNSIEFNFNWGFYLNCGQGHYSDIEISCGIDEKSYADIVKRSLSLNPKIIGACCGSNPKHIKSIKNLFYGKTDS